jgi:glucose/arabinose dehydrogenase
MKISRRSVVLLAFRAIGLAALIRGGPPVQAQTPTPSVVDPNLAVRTVASGFVTPINLAFLGLNDMLVLEKNSGRVLRVVDGVVQSTVLDLAVNSASERGLLSIALHPKFSRNHAVYLYWTCTAPPPTDPFIPSLTECPDTPELGADTNDVLAVPLLGNRVDRFNWDGTSLTFDRNIIKLRAFQNDATNTGPRGNHNGGVIVFGGKGRGDDDRDKLFIQMGDNGRRGQMQNLEDGPFGPGIADDQFGGPEPDDAHLTGVILRLNDDGSAPRDNPFFEHGAAVGGEVGANLQKVFAYGIRNGFGMAVDPVSGDLWEQENGDDSFSELNRVEPGMNSGWVQIMGPVSRVAQFKEIETSPQFLGLQQTRWPPTNIKDTPEEALDSLFALPGSRYSVPEFAWKYEVAPGGIGFVGRGLGPRYQNDLIMGGARPFLEGGHLFRFELTRSRRSVAVDDPRLNDRVADNVAKFEITESESLLFGRNFGTVTDIKTGPDGTLYLVSIDHGNIYQIRRRQGGPKP